MTALLTAASLRHAYRQKPVLDGVSLSVEAGEFVSIIGPNGSGKSTLLRCLGRLLKPASGTVALGDREIWGFDPREFARRVAFVPQGPLAPPDLVVEELVWRGRFPHRGLFGRRTAHDKGVVERAIALADVQSLRSRAIGTLSGGERQRAFIALALAQEPQLMLLDEPTTFLDIAHQLDLLALLGRLNREQGLTVVTVMHDLGQAAMFSPRIIAIRDGGMIADGPPKMVLTTRLMKAIFGADLRVTPDPETGSLLVLPAVPKVAALPRPKRAATPRKPAAPRPPKAPSG